MSAAIREVNARALWGGTAFVRTGGGAMRGNLLRAGLGTTRCPGQEWKPGGLLSAPSCDTPRTFQAYSLERKDAVPP